MGLGRLWPKNPERNKIGGIRCGASRWQGCVVGLCASPCQNFSIIYACMHAYIHAYLHAYVRAHIHVHIHVHIHINIHIHIHIYIYIYTDHCPWTYSFGGFSVAVRSDDKQYFRTGKTWPQGGFQTTNTSFLPISLVVSQTQILLSTLMYRTQACSRVFEPSNSDTCPG